MSWSVLPAELRWKVFENLTISKRRAYQSPEDRRAERKRTTQSERGLQSQYAAVNTEWQTYFELANFGHLILDYSDVCDFNDIVSGCHRGRLVRWIWLRVQLPEYGCGQCSKPESPKEQKAHEVRFTTALWELFYSLATFSNRHPGITLELSVHSPSDSEHHCQELKNTINDTMWHVSREYNIHKPNDRAHGWSNGRLQGLEPGAHMRHFGTPSGLGINLEEAHMLHKTRPVVRVIKRLIIRLQFFRHFSISRGLSPIIECLPRLARLTYECRQGINSGRPVVGQRERQEEHRLFGEILRNCRTLTKLVLYEKSNHTYSHRPSPIDPDPVAGQVLELYSSNLQELYGSWMVDAKDFLHVFWPGATAAAEQDPGRAEWPHLKRLFLTTTALTPGAWSPLIQAAAAAAKRMPKLEKMEFWGHTGSNRFYYQVQMQERRCTILLPRGMSHKSEKAITRCWQDVALMHGSLFELKIENIPWCVERFVSSAQSIAGYSATYPTILQLRTEHLNR